MRNVWILNHYAQEPGGAGGTRHFNLAKHLKAYGWSASIIAASVEHQSGRQRLGDDENFRHENFDGVPFLWLKTSEYSGNGGGRMRNMLEYAWKLVMPGSLRGVPRPEVIVGSSVHLFTGLAGFILSRRYKVPFVFEVRDLWPQTLIDMGRLREGSLVARLMRLLEGFLYKRAARIVVLLPDAWKYIVPIGISRDRIVWIPNGVDLSAFPYSPVVERACVSPFSLMYFGAHGQANGLDSVIVAMKIVQDAVGPECIKLRMIGDGPLRSDLIRKAQSLNLDNISFELPVPKSEIPSVALQADAFIISVLNLPKLYRYGISMNKLFDYLAAARPVIIASDASNNPVKDGGAGLAVGADDPNAIAEAILKVAAMSVEERRKMGDAGRAYVEMNHEFTQLSGVLATVLDEVTAPIGSGS